MPFTQDRAGGSGIDSSLTRREGERDDVLVAGGGEIGARLDETHSIAVAAIRGDEHIWLESYRQYHAFSNSWAR
ncbi:hypothetical protein HDV64DRAFT_243613 [Trichoderma sp. TUCIM 5745]